MTECIICGEKYTKVKNSLVKCEYCGHASCRVCYVTYFKEEGICKCMNKQTCDKEWSRRHLVKYMSNVFMTKDYKDIQEKRVLDSQKALLPETMHLVKEQQEHEKIQEEIAKIDDEIQELMMRKVLLSRNKKTAPAHIYIRSCFNENCRGFLNTSWKCDLCSMYTCKDCHLVLGTERNNEHICDEGIKANVQLLAKDTKNCPKCQEGIFKIDGCDQMWCIKCHTAFSWKTGRIETTIHNPHYYEYLRETTGNVPRNILDIPEPQCLGDQQITHRMQRIILSCYETYIKMPKKPPIIFVPNEQNKLTRFIRSASHITHYEIPRFETNADNTARELRISYLRKRISEENFAQKLFKMQKRSEKNNEYANILNMYARVSTDLVLRAYNATHNMFTTYRNMIKITTNYGLLHIYANTIHDILKEAQELEKYVQKIFQDIAKVYKCVEKKIKIINCKQHEQYGIS